MKDVKIQITLDLKLDISNDAFPEKGLIRNIERAMHREISQGLLPDTIETWDMDIRQIDPTKIATQVEIIRELPDYVIHVFFSSDGPAILVGPTNVVSPINADLLREINNAIREAHHKYLEKVREG